MTRHGPLVSTDTVQVVMGYTNGGSNLENVYHVHKGSAWSLGDVNLLVEAFLGWEDTNAKILRGSAVELVRVTATDLTSLAGARVDSQLPTPTGGTHDGLMLPANVTIAIKGSIGKRGRGRQGRTFWIGLTSTMTTEDSIVIADANLIADALAVLLTSVEASVPGATLGVIHQFIDRVWQADAPFDTILDWAITDYTLDSQRDRLPGHKRRKSKPVA